jgi:hypothetical protein
MKKIIKILRGALVLGEEWSRYQNKMLNNLNGGGGDRNVKPIKPPKKKVPPE